MSAGLLKTIALSVALACTVPTAFAADLTAGAVAAPDQYGAKVAAHILQAGGKRGRCGGRHRLYPGGHLP